MSLPALIQAMCQPQFYDHPVADSIKVLQTHISFVILTGDYAYKVKKAVNFGFLDFSTLNKRRHFCYEEIRLNRRLAPDLYLGVVGITARGIIGLDEDTPPDQVLEYAVKMRQFDQQQLGSNLFDRGEFLPEYAQMLGKQVAEFHQRAMTNEYISQFGTASAMQKVAQDNYHHTLKYVGIAQTQSQLEETKAYTDRIFQEKAHIWLDRVAQGKIRECHGDIHLQNICLYQGKIQIFDCIEFNEPFRNTDTLYDASFLVMDLQFRGRWDLANIFLNSYLEFSNDYSGVELLALFCSMRAYIRAKVTSFLLDDATIPPAQRQSAQQTAQQYYRLAWQYTQPTQGQIWMACGVSGSGKSTLARQLAPLHNAIIIRSDAIRKHLAGIDLMERGDQSIYSPAMTQQVYAQLQHLGISLAQAGYTVILDAKYDRLEWRTPLITTAQRMGIPIQILFCTAPTEVLVQRLLDRASANNDITDATVDLLAQQQQNFQPLTETEIPLIKTV
jgi:aminoglycoside phosphotransferase family enzyme/predicted kinase